MTILNTLQLLMQSLSGDTNALDTLFGDGIANTFIRTDIADLVARDSANMPNGSSAFVLSEGETYRLDTTNSFATDSKLIIARGAGPGRWFRKSKAYVIGNFTTWIATSNFAGKNLILGFTPGQLTSTSTVTPDIILTGPSAGTSWSVVPDLLGNLWWNIEGIAAGNQILRKLALKDCLDTGAPTPSVTLAIASSGITSSTLAFDKANNLWAWMSQSAALKKITQPQYAASGAPTPPVSMGATGLIGTSQYQLFDDLGNMWSAAFGGQIHQLTAAQLASGVTVAPSIILSGANVNGPSGLAIGPSGLLWCANYAAGHGKLRAYNPVGAVTGTPAIVIELTSSSFVGVTDIFFDSSGNLWFLNFDNGQIGRIAASNITVSGAIIPDFVVTFGGASAGTFPASFNYPNNPTRSGLVPSGEPQ